MGHKKTKKRLMNKTAMKTPHDAHVGLLDRIFSLSAPSTTWQYYYFKMFYTIEKVVPCYIPRRNLATPSVSGGDAL